MTQQICDDMKWEATKNPVTVLNPVGGYKDRKVYEEKIVAAFTIVLKVVHQKICRAAGLKYLHSHFHWHRQPS